MSEQIQRNMVFITGGEDVQAWVYQNLGQGYWSAGFNLILEKHGYLGFDLATHEVLAKPDELSQYDLAIVSWLPKNFWQPAYMEGLRSFKGALFLEGPFPPMVLDYLGLENRPPIELDKSVLSICDPTTKKLFEEKFASLLRDGRIEIGPKKVFTFGVSVNRWENDLDIAQADFRTIGQKVARSYITSYMYRLHRNTLFPDAWDNVLLAYVLAKYQAMGGFAPEEEITNLAGLCYPALSKADGDLASDVAEAARYLLQDDSSPPTASHPFEPSLGITDKLRAFLRRAITIAKHGRKENRRQNEQRLRLLSASLPAQKAALTPDTIKELLDILDKDLELSDGVAATKAGLELPSCCLLAIGLVTTGKREAARSFLHELITRALDTEKGFVRNLSLRGKIATPQKGYCLSPLVPLALLEAIGAIEREPYFGSTLDQQYGADRIEIWKRTPLTINPVRKGPGSIEAEFHGEDACPLIGILRSGRKVVFTFPAFSYIIQAHTMHPLSRPFYDYDGKGALGLQALFFHLLEEQANRLNISLSKIEPWPWGHDYCLTIRHDVDRIPDEPVMKNLLDFHRKRELGVSWYWIHNRLNSSYLELIQAAGQEIGLHSLKHKNRSKEISGILENLNKQTAIHGDFPHGGGGGDNWLGHPSVAASSDSGLQYTLGISAHYSLPYRFPALTADGKMRFEDIICMGHNLGVESNDKNPNAWHINYSRMDGMVDNGFHLVLSNHPDINFERLKKLIDLDFAQKNGRIDWTACQVADWWRKTHCRENLSMGLKRAPDGALIYAIKSEFDIQGLALSIALPGWSPDTERPLPEGYKHRTNKSASGLHWLQVRLNLKAGIPVEIKWPERSIV